MKLDQKSIGKLFAGVNRLNPDGGLLTDNSMSNVREFIDTGSYALNAICSGSLYGGIPKGRIVGLSGPSACGKTLMLNKIIGNFQRENPNNWAVVWDSEVAEDERTARSLGADPDKIMHYPIDSVTKMRNQILKLLDIIIENKLEGRFLIGIDSLGNLAGSKELADSEKDKMATDMGTRAKEIKSMLRVLTYKAAKANTTIVFTNHVYNDPTAMYESIIKSTAGGKGPEYMASLLLQFGVKREKHDATNDADQIMIGSKGISGATLHVLTSKNRIIPPFLTVDLYLNFKTGLHKYEGLFELVKGFGIIEGDKTYALDGRKLGFYKKWKNDTEVWDIIMPRLEEKIAKEWQYNTDDVDAVLNEVKKEIGDE